MGTVAVSSFAILQQAVTFRMPGQDIVGVFQGSQRLIGGAVLLLSAVLSGISKSGLHLQVNCGAAQGCNAKPAGTQLPCGLASASLGPQV